MEDKRELLKKLKKIEELREIVNDLKSLDIILEKRLRERLNEIRIMLYDVMCNVLVGYLKIAAEHKFG